MNKVPDVLEIFESPMAGNPFLDLMRFCPPAHWFIGSDEDTEERNRQLQGALDALSARLDAMETKQPRQQRRQREDQDALA